MGKRDGGGCATGVLTGLKIWQMEASRLVALSVVEALVIDRRSYARYKRVGSHSLPSFQFGVVSGLNPPERTGMG